MGLLLMWEVDTGQGLPNMIIVGLPDALCPGIQRARPIGH